MGGASDLKHPLDGMVGGAMGASLAESIIGLLPDTLSPQTRSDITRMSVALITLFTGQDVNASILTATNAIENNALRTLHLGRLAQLVVQLTLNRRFDSYSAHQENQGVERIRDFAKTISGSKSEAGGRIWEPS